MRRADPTVVLAINPSDLRQPLLACAGAGRQCASSAVSRRSLACLCHSAQKGSPGFRARVRVEGQAMGQHVCVRLAETVLRRGHFRERPGVRRAEDLESNRAARNGEISGARLIGSAYAICPQSTVSRFSLNWPMPSLFVSAAFEGNRTTDNNNPKCLGLKMVTIGGPRMSLGRRSPLTGVEPAG